MRSRYAALLTTLALPTMARASEPTPKNRTPYAEIRQNKAAESDTISVLAYNTSLSCSVLAPHANCASRAHGIREAVLTRVGPVQRQPDILVFSEGMHSTSPPILRRELKPGSFGGTRGGGTQDGAYPFYTSILVNTAGPLDLTSGGIWIQSRWPIENGPRSTDPEGFPQNDGEDIVFGDEHFYGIVPSPSPGDCPTHHPDSLASKGVKYARIRHPSGRKIHVFGTHLQADYQFVTENDDDRKCQLNTIANFIESRNISRDETVIIAGDLNFGPDPGVWPLENERLDAWNLEMPPWGWGDFGLPNSFDRNTNNYWPLQSDYSPIGLDRIDHVLYSARFRRPRRMSNYVHKFQSNGVDLSEHHPVLSDIDLDGPVAAAPKPMRVVFNSALNRVEFTSSTWPSIVTKDYMSLLTGDFDADGRTDVLLPFVPDAGFDPAAKILVKRGVDTAWTAFKDPLTLGHRDIFVAGNFDGVGGTDVARIVVDPNTTAATAQNVDIGVSVGTSFNFNNFNTTNPWASWMTHRNLVVFAAELNGGSRTDLVKIENGGEAWGAVSRLDPVSGLHQFFTTAWTSGLAYNANEQIALPGDFDGNGQTDVAILRVRSNTGAGVTNQPIHVLRNTAAVGSVTGSFVKDGNGAGGAWITNQTFSPDWKYLPADINGDGRTDIVVIESIAGGTNDSPRLWKAFISTGTNGAAAGAFVLDVLGRTTAFQNGSYGTARTDKFLVGQFDNVAGDDLLQVRVAMDNNPSAFGNLYFKPRLSRPFSNTDVDLLEASTALFGFHHDTTREMHMVSGDFDNDGITDLASFPVY